MAQSVTVVITQAAPPVSKVAVSSVQTGNVALVKVMLPGVQGPQGAQGIPGTGQGLTLTALGPINAFTIVRDAGNGAVITASSLNPADADEALGLALNSAQDGGVVNIQSAGLLSDPSWTWVSGPIFVGPNGNLTQTPPVTGFLQQVAVAVSPTQLVLGLKPSITLF